MKTKQDFEIIFWIEYMHYNNPKLLSEHIGISKEEAEKKLRKFEKQGLIEIEMREGRIYGSRLTKKGKKIFKDVQYNKWKEELGY
jgi:DNA-binding MarR family transcriptional regulator